ncbi:MAG: hypothetical protein QN122_08040 [Armatimonadota bacterium]|nr:hypothetical protein [Armatimonadota bacterium]MDR7448173.1 hypothetical protein [Armatimonadota bacterium]MDR7458894.1 hypothetical protein [Armatimonadota bacterium]MDR7479180.1 hypothetical protein [Armatimonadota bacterium]MDR7487608.1 hypothetical protein [Armatimonadota bacterium]
MAVALAGLARPVPVLTVTDEAGGRRWLVPVEEGSPVVLEYVNSIWGAPTWERFVVRSGRLALVEVASTAEAVLEYHRLPAPYRREDGRLAAPVTGVTLDALTLRVGERGRPVLHVDGASLPLFDAGVGTGLRVEVRRLPRLRLWLAEGRG